MNKLSWSWMVVCINHCQFWAKWSFTDAVLEISGRPVVWDNQKVYQFLVKLRGWLPGEKTTDNPAKNRK